MERFEEESTQSGFVLYQTEDGRTRIASRFENETVWLTQKLMAELFHKDVRTINEHIQNILAEDELDGHSVIRKFRITATDEGLPPGQRAAQESARCIFLHNGQTRLDDFLRFNDRAILPDAGKVTRNQADELAKQEYDRFAARRREQLEIEGARDTLQLLEANVKKLPVPRKSKSRTP